MKQILLYISTSLLFFTYFTVTSHASDIQPITKLISERLSHMQNVALFKEANHIPIEDLEQESRIIERSLERAQALGLDQDSVRYFIDIQMKAAKAVQYRYRADWLFKTDNISAPKTLDNDRNQISALGNELLELIAQRLKKGTGIKKSDQDFFISSLSSYNLQHEEKNKIFNALLNVKLAH